MCIKNLFLTKLSMIMKSVRSYVAFLATLSIVLMTSCSENNSVSPTGKVNLKFSVSDVDLNSSGGRTAGAVSITDFQISIRDVIFMTDHDDGIADDSIDWIPWPLSIGSSEWSGCNYRDNWNRRSTKWHLSATEV